jgi:hypothetical protein
VLKFTPKTVEIFLVAVYNISTFQQIPPPNSAENNVPAIDGGYTADIGGYTHFTTSPPKEAQIKLHVTK